MRRGGGKKYSVPSVVLIAAHAQMKYGGKAAAGTMESSHSPVSNVPRCGDGHCGH
jgi:hypothetical protein